MGLRRYIGDIVEAVVTTAKGLRITAKYGVNPREEITIQYPEERWTVAERFRGFLHNDVKRCTSCQMCVRVCPVDCISLEAVRGADKKLVLVSYDINIGRCMFCGLCVEACPTKSLTHTSGYEKASLDRGELVLHFVEEDPAEIRARVARQVAEAQAKAAEAARAAAPAAGAGSGGPAAKEGGPGPGVAGTAAAEAPRPAPVGNPAPRTAPDDGGKP